MKIHNHSERMRRMTGVNYLQNSWSLIHLITWSQYHAKLVILPTKLTHSSNVLSLILAREQLK